MTHQQRRESIAQLADARHGRPEVGEEAGFVLLTVCIAVASRILIPPDHANCEAGDYMAPEREGDNEGFCGGGLVVGAGEEEVRLAGGHTAGEQRDEGGVGDVHRGEGGEDIGRVLLDAHQVPDGAVLLLSSCSGEPENIAAPSSDISLAVVVRRVVDAISGDGFELVKKVGFGPLELRCIGHGEFGMDTDIDGETEGD